MTVTINGATGIAGVSGTATLPAVQGGGDTNTGVFYPVADTVAISTGGTEQMRVSNAGVAVSAGTATAAPLNLTSGTNLTTATAGAMEYDGTVFYATPTALQRGVIMAEQIILLQSAYTLTSQTAAQAMFNTPAGGQVTLTAGTYEFECFYSLSAMSATSGSFGFALGGTATKTQFFWSLAQKGAAAVATATATQSTYNVAANTTLATASVNTVGYANISGIINVSVSGTIIPQVSLGIAAAAVVGIGAYFRIRPIGSTTVTSVGAWT
jgi:hypothetical protein